MKYVWTNYVDENFYCTTVESSLDEQTGHKPILRRGKTVRAMGINPMPRFAAIMAPLFEALPFDDDAATTARQEVENILYKFLAQVDFVGANTPISLITAYFHGELQNGNYGAVIQALFTSIPAPEQNIIARHLAWQELGAGRRLLFREAIEELFPGVRLYFYRDEERFAVWLPFAETEERVKILSLWEKLFLAASCREPRYFWQYHFGIIGRDETMHLDEIAIY